MKLDLWGQFCKWANLPIHRASGPRWDTGWWCFQDFMCLDLMLESNRPSKMRKHWKVKNLVSTLVIYKVYTASNYWFTFFTPILLWKNSNILKKLNRTINTHINNLHSVVNSLLYLLLSYTYPSIHSSYLFIKSSYFSSFLKLPASVYFTFKYLSMHLLISIQYLFMVYGIFK